MRFLLLCLVTLSLTACGDTESERFKACDTQQFDSPTEYIECLYPHPPIGRWHAVYTKEFAEEYNLPKENISSDFSEGVDYMEMEVLPYGINGTACLASMLVKKPHDIALYSDNKILYDVFKSKKLLRLIEIDEYRDQLKPLLSFSSAARDYKIEKSGYSATTFGAYAEDVLFDYDYFSANKICRDVSTHAMYFPNGYAFNVNRASVWGKYERIYKRLEDSNRPKTNKEIEDSHIFINIPEELISKIFKDVPIGGQ